MRVEHVLRQALDIRLSVATEAIRSGSVHVDGKCVMQPSYQLLLGAQRLSLDGIEVDTSKVFHRLLLFNKPRGSVCVSAKDERSIFRLLPPHQQHPNLSFFGRLDRDTTGLMLLGTDGGIGALLTDPGSSITKEYWAGLSGGSSLCADAKERFRDGMELSDGIRCCPAELDVDPELESGASENETPPTEGEITPASDNERRRGGLQGSCQDGHASSPSQEAQVCDLFFSAAAASPRTSCAAPWLRSAVAEGRTVVRVTLHEGKFHQVKRMLGACGGSVANLHRESFCSLRLSQLKPPIDCGTARPPTEAELRIISAMLPMQRDAVSRSGMVHERRRAKWEHNGAALQKRTKLERVGDSCGSGRRSGSGQAASASAAAAVSAEPSGSAARVADGEVAGAAENRVLASGACADPVRSCREAAIVRPHVPALGKPAFVRSKPSSVAEAIALDRSDAVCERLSQHLRNCFGGLL